MRFFLLFGTLFLALLAGAESPARNLWAELKAKREKLPSIHQEFEVSQTYRTASNSQSSKRQIVLDMSKGQWREKFSSGSGDYIRIFDGKDLFQMEEAGNEYLRPKRRSKEEETGLLIASLTSEAIDNGRTTYQSDVTRVVRRLAYGSPPDMSLFRLPSTSLREVKELSRWNAAKIKKELAGKSAPELTVTDLRGEPVALSALKGRTVLLDFWTTWCPPCRADAPALDKLHRKYGDKELTIVGISVSEEREIVEKFLKEHPHSFPVVLTTENEMPRPYQVGVFPTYIVIDREGTVAAAVEGDKGFGDLLKLLKKAGIETD
jgi:thiol-disulfide isomerase/thioredoxin